MRPKLFEVVFDFPVALVVIAVTLAWSMLQLRWERPLPWGEALQRALRALATFGSAGSTEKTDISVPGSLGTVALALGVYGLVRAPVHLPVFGYAAMAFCGFTATAIAGWKTGPKLGVPPWTAIRVAFLCAFFGILGSRFFYVVEYWEEFSPQPARVTFGRLAPQKGETLEARTALGSAKVTFTGDERTPSQVVAELGPLAGAGVHAKLIEHPYLIALSHTLETRERGFEVFTDATGPSAQLVLTGTVLHDRPTISAEGYAPPWTDIFAIWNGGLVYYGGMLFGTAAVLVFVRMQGQRIAQVADLASSVGALGIAFGRMGCFLNGCCWGRRSELPWAIKFKLFTPAWIQHAQYTLGADYDPLIGGRQLAADVALDPRLQNALQGAGKDAAQLCTASWPLHPVQVYAIFLDLAMFAIIFPFVMKKAKREWQTFFLWFIVYGVVRFVIEHFRGDSDGFLPVLGYPLTPSQQVAVLTVPFAIVGFIWASRKGRPLERWTPPPASGSPPAAASTP